MLLGTKRVELILWNTSLCVVCLAWLSRWRVLGILGVTVMVLVLLMFKCVFGV